VLGCSKGVLFGIDGASEQPCWRRSMSPAASLSLPAPLLSLSRSRHHRALLDPQPQKNFSNPQNTSLLSTMAALVARDLKPSPSTLPSAAPSPLLRIGGGSRASSDAGTDEPNACSSIDSSTEESSESAPPVTAAAAAVSPPLINPPAMPPAAAVAPSPAAFVPGAHILHPARSERAAGAAAVAAVPPYAGVALLSASAHDMQLVMVDDVFMKYTGLGSPAAAQRAGLWSCLGVSLDVLAASRAAGRAGVAFEVGTVVAHRLGGSMHLKFTAVPASARAGGGRGADGGGHYVVAVDMLNALDTEMWMPGGVARRFRLLGE